MSEATRSQGGIERRFVKSVLLAAAVAAGLPAFVLVAGPFVGVRFATAAWIGALGLLHAGVVAARTLATPPRVRLRSLATDLALTVLGIGVALGLATPGLSGAMLATWGFSLVQCLRLLAPAHAVSPGRPSQDERFEAACARARDLLESA